MSRKRALTGIQPSGVPHVGNLKGMIEPAVALQERSETFYFIASYHALTTMRDPKRLRELQREAATVFLAFGFDPGRGALFLQQDVPEVTELAWILACHTGLGLMDRGHAVKAAQDGGQAITLGTYNYPVLMAADILLYDSDLVPVGQDQKQHVEMARLIARSVNHTYGEVLRIPEAVIQEEVAVVPGLDGRKMSKSYGNDVSVLLSGKKLRKRLMQVVTDSTPMEDPKDPQTCNVFALYKLFADADQQRALAARYRAGNFGYGHAKQALYEVVGASLAAPQARYAELVADPAQVDRVLERGADQARTVARATMARVRDAVGL